MLSPQTNTCGHCYFYAIIILVSERERDDWRIMYFGVLMFVILLILANFAIALVTYICGDITEEIAVRTFVFLFCAMILVLLVQPIL